MIRKMTKADLPRILEIETICFHDAWKKSHYEYELNDNPYASMWVICQDEKIVGYYDLWIIFERAEIANIAILPEYQNRGLGSKLMDHLINKAIENECETISLEVRVSNEKALRLYEKYDFSIINTKKGYYKYDGMYEDAYFMMRGI